MSAVPPRPARAQFSLHHGGRALWIVGEGARMETKVLAGVDGEVVSAAQRVADPLWCAGAEALADHLPGAGAAGLKRVP